MVRENHHGLDQLLNENTPLRRSTGLPHRFHVDLAEQLGNLFEPFGQLVPPCVLRLEMQCSQMYASVPEMS